MNNIERGSGVPRKTSNNSKKYRSSSSARRNSAKTRTQTTNKVNSPYRKRKRKKRSNFLDLVKALIVALIGVVVIAFLIMGIKNILTPDDEVNALLDASSAVTTENMLEAGRDDDLLRVTPSPATETDISNLEYIHYGDMCTVGNVGYEYYKFDLDLANEFVDAVNDSVSKLNDNVNVYSMIIPSAVDIMLPLSFLEENADKTSDQEKAIRYFYNTFDKSIKTVDLYDYLKAHCDEKLYYYTDNKITSLAAYYIYDELCFALGEEETSLSEYSTASVNGFLGNINAFIGSTEVSTEETIKYYIPSDEITVDGESLFRDVSSETALNKYNVFLGGSSALKHLENADINDGSCAVVVGDGTSNSIVPYIAQNYQDVYFVNYLYYEDDLAALVDEVNAQDVIYAFNISATNTQSWIDDID